MSSLLSSLIKYTLWGLLFCSHLQKAAVVRLIQRHTGKRTAAVGDGGNDVSMIQAADAGIGIVGKVKHSHISSCFWVDMRRTEQ